MTSRSRSAAIRAELGHPVIDGDGHIVEMIPVLADFIRDHGRADIVDEVALFGAGRGAQSAQAAMTVVERRRAGLVPATWTVPSDADYFATVTTPARYHERLAEAGIDFAVLYPTFGLSLLQIDDPDHRVSVCRLFNEYLAEEHRAFGDRFTVAAAVPMHTPDEAVAGLEHARAIGAKVALIPSWVRRPREGDDFAPDDLERLRPTGFGFRGWLDTFGLDSAHDYDVVWAKAIELGMPLAVHSPGMGFDDRQSATSFTFNGVGHFAAAGVALAKSLFLGGVLRRFPALRVAVLEGGVATGLETCVRLAGFWEKRGGRALDALDPANLDEERLAELYAERDPRLAAYPARSLAAMIPDTPRYDDFADAGVESVDDIVEQWCRAFAWGCEADDPLVGLAFDARLTPGGARLPAFMGSDIGHWDVPVFDSPVAEAYELVERGVVDHDQLRAFLFTNPVEFYGSLDAGFFAGTCVEREAAAVLSAGASAAARAGRVTVTPPA